MERSIIENAELVILILTALYTRIQIISFIIRNN